ncbi:hypothetical protein TTHT_1997 [Thermotomaculum hydrothermale]|uniref:RHS repeat-associated core domain-containing protein n=1 Tax=Thermotomaculum hydrothermale TaxID=981385 RepID=A0A7R6PYY0_9BACT|nr:RHS repeat-associated core domain-containing protein [Thermotomaculum hydrothermale]BBB33440.1 hypothetical protein TTHT_1997 [Thermotomaculum hydrothermale]
MNSGKKLKSKLNDFGEILHTTDTLAYGEELTAPYENNKDEVLNTITYTGHEKDYETDLTYMLARYYSSQTGRFLSPDPGYDYDQLDPMSWNLYSYVRGNPVMRIDPYGRQAATTLDAEAERKLLEEKAKIKARLQYETNAGKMHPKSWAGIQPNGKPVPELKSAKTVEREKKEQEAWKKAGEEAEKKTKVERLNTVIQTSDNLVKDASVIATASLTTPQTISVTPIALATATYASAVSVIASGWKANITGSKNDWNEFKAKTFSFGISTIATKFIENLSLPKPLELYLQTVVNDASVVVDSNSSNK